MTSEAAAPADVAHALRLTRQGCPSRGYAVALAVHDRARETADDRTLAEAADCLAYCCILLARFEKGVGFARTASVVWQERGEAVREALARGRLAMLLAWVCEPDALEEAERALALAERTADRDATSWALQAHALAHMMLSQHDRAVSFAERALAMAGEPGTTILACLFLAESLVQRAIAAPEDDGPENDGPEKDEQARAPDDSRRREGVGRALGLTDRGLAFARSIGEGSLERLMINNIAEYSLYVGDVATAEQALAEFAGARGEMSERVEAHHHLIRARLLRAQGRDDAALEPLAACCALTSADDLELGPMCLLETCEVHAALGRFEAALEAHRAYHRQHVRRMSEAAQRRARLSALRDEAEALRVAVAQAQARADDLFASNQTLSREAERLLRTTLEDPLTGLANRRRLDVAFLNLLASNAPFALAMIDLDHFKRVNDRFSHLVGDAVLREVAALLAASARREDLAVRYGGEEFALLLVGTEPSAAEQACERLRERIAAHGWFRVAPGLSVTASFGLAESCEAPSGQALLALADRRLYEAKRLGRNRVVSRAVTGSA